MKKGIHAVAVLIALAMSIPLQVRAQDEQGSAADLAKKLANPIASLISVPFLVGLHGGDAT